MPRDIHKLARVTRDYIRELDHEAIERVEKGAWITASLGTEIFCEKPDEEIILDLATKLPEFGLTLHQTWLRSFVSIAKQWCEINLYANQAWPEDLVKLYEKHGVKEKNRV